MTDPKKSIFVQLYQPASLQSDPNDQNAQLPLDDSQFVSQKTGGQAPEGDMFTNSGASPAEYMPIQEYVEPDLAPDMQQFMQNSSPQFEQVQQVPVVPIIPPTTLTPVMHPTLPLSDDQIEKELKTDVYTAIRWLAEWCLRQLKTDALNKKSDIQEPSLSH
jgi:hypothetical protein